MTSRTTGDTETIRKLGEILEAHRGDAEAWGRFGGLLRTQRVLIGYGNRRRFVAERCGPPGDPNSLDYHFICDIERGLNASRRKGYSLSRMLAVAAAYGITLESAGAALDGGELEAVQAPAPASFRPAVPPPAVLMSGVLSLQAIAAAGPYVTRIFRRMHALAITKGIAQPSGSDLFAVDLTAEGIEDVYRQRPREHRAAGLWGAYADGRPRMSGCG